MLNIIADHFSQPEMVHRLNVLAEHGWGFEYWFQIELLVGLIDSGIKASVKGKTAYDADVLVQEDDKTIGIELRTWKQGFWGDSLTSGIEKHPGADLYLFIVQKQEEKIAGVKQWLVDHGYIHIIRDINHDWILMLVKKEQPSD